MNPELKETIDQGAIIVTNMGRSSNVQLNSTSSWRAKIKKYDLMCVLTFCKLKEHVQSAHIDEAFMALLRDRVCLSTCIVMGSTLVDRTLRGQLLAAVYIFDSARGLLIVVVHQIHCALIAGS